VKFWSSQHTAQPLVPKGIRHLQRGTADLDGIAIVFIVSLAFGLIMLVQGYIKSVKDARVERHRLENHQFRLDLQRRKNPPGPFERW
jgi:hypothetical protein